MKNLDKKGKKEIEEFSSDEDIINSKVDEQESEEESDVEAKKRFVKKKIIIIFYALVQLTFTFFYRYKHRKFRQNRE